jgi:hypothetical protein
MNFSLVELNNNSNNKNIRTKQDEMRNNFRDLALLIVDEVSMVGTAQIGRMDKILRMLRERQDEPFGGVTVVFMGDFYQLPPVGLPSIASDVLHYRQAQRQPFQDVHREIGAQVASNWRKIELLRQVRAAEDDAHTKRIETFRNANIRSPITPALIQSFKVLCQADFEEDPAWASASILVASNSERVNIINDQMRRFAKQNGLPLIRWKKQLSENQPKIAHLNENQLEGLYNTCNELHG